MASNPEWCQPVGVWTRRFRDWMQESGPAEVLAACIFFDLRPVGGAAELASSLRTVIQTDAPGSRRLLGLLARDVVDRPVALTVFGNRPGGAERAASRHRRPQGWRRAPARRRRPGPRARARPRGDEHGRPVPGGGHAGGCTARPSAARSRTPISSSSGSGSSTSSAAWNAASRPTTGSARGGCRARRRCSCATRSAPSPTSRRDSANGTRRTCSSEGPGSLAPVARMARGAAPGPPAARDAARRFRGHRPRDDGTRCGPGRRRGGGGRAIPGRRAHRRLRDPRQPRPAHPGRLDADPRDHGRDGDGGAPPG